MKKLPCFITPFFYLAIMHISNAHAQTVTLHYTDANGVVDDVTDPAGELLDSSAAIQSLADPNFDTKKGAAIYTELEKTDTAKAEKDIVDHEAKANAARRDYESDPVRE